MKPEKERLGCLVLFLLRHFVALLDGFVDRAAHVERLLRQVVILAVTDTTEATNGFGQRDVSGFTEDPAAGNISFSALLTFRHDVDKTKLATFFKLQLF